MLAAVNSNGRLLKVCPYSATVEMVMYHCKIPYKLIAVNLFGKAKESWYKPLREDGKSLLHHFYTVVENGYLKRKMLLKN